MGTPSRAMVWVRAGFVALLLTGCSHSPEQPRAGVTLRVFAASSLTESFQALADAFETRRPEVDVQLTLAGSQVLRLQIAQGARADVFASANRDHMQALHRAGLVRRPATFAENALVLVVPRKAAQALHSFEELPQARRVVLGSPHVPVGRYARRVLRRAAARYGPEFRAAVRAHVVSLEPNVRLVRAKVALGEADAAFVYQTDARSSDAVRALAIPPELNVRARYPIAVVEEGDHAAVAEAFVAFVRSEAGQAVLARHGFARVRP